MPGCPSKNRGTGVRTQGLVRSAAGVQVVLAKLREERGDKFTVTIARRQIRKWLRNSDEGAAVEVW